MPDPDLVAESLLPDVPFARLRELVLGLAQEQELPVERNDPGALVVGTAYGRLGFEQRPEGAAARITAPRADHLQALKDSIVGQVSAAWPEAAQALRWSDGAGAGRLPPNVRLMALESIEALDCGFLRIALAGDVSRFSDDAIHFRLGLPPRGLACPEWPRLGDNGATVWPKGDAALQLPVYTARHVDPARGRLVFDLFLHDGGRAGDWLRAAAPGTEMAVIGPGGGGCRVEGEIRAFADETAFPAIARLLERNPDLTGEITLQAGSATTRAYPLPDHPGLRLHRPEGLTPEIMAERAIAAMEAAPEAYLWFAGERDAAQHLRRAYRQAGRPPRRSYISAYWTKAA
ncbi:siderophore-interacting protein [Salipiger mucosus]|uniref:Iron-chelator utilization protein n=1 Tax=Salipiger mucosus DSM 16094 TaxID=1123237 RepID=S9RWE3_9RHOB|nr:siderophore-interacting protein [Salipiger mucosus]EPX78334.1 iron-chelator utilization protein [Salipiger mucosus DSM 16094]